MAFYDKEKLKAEHNIMDVAKRLGLDNFKKRGEGYRRICPSGQSDDPTKFVITPEKGVWYSWALNRGGDVISLVELVKRCSFSEACKWLQGEEEPEKKSGTPAEVPDRRAEGEPAPEPSEGFRALDYLVSDHEMVIAVGFDPDFAATHGIGFAPRGVMRGQIAIPVRSSKGKLLGYIGVTDCRLPSRWHE